MSIFAASEKGGGGVVSVPVENLGLTLTLYGPLEPGFFSGEVAAGVAAGVAGARSNKGGIPGAAAPTAGAAAPTAGAAA